MELKNMKKHNNLNLLMYNLKDKKNWFLVSIAIMAITLIIMPLILNAGIGQGIIIIGLLEIGTLLFLNALIDLSYFHDNRKLTYYVSKPGTKMERINSVIFSNIVFVALLLTFLFAIGIFSGVDISTIQEIFIPTVPWLVIGILVMALSSALTGNTIAAGVASIINFTLPLSILAIIYYGFEVIGHFALGFNPRILFNSFIESFYRIDILYFIKYVEESFTLDYFLVLAAWIVIVYSLIVYVVKRRKNERTGDFIVVDGYKNMISLIIASLIPIGFSEAFYNASIAERISSFIILSGLTYYLINAILEKSFKISKYALKLFVVFIIVFGMFVGGTNLAAGKFESKVPEAEEINAIYFGSDGYIWSEDYEETWDIYNATKENIDESPYAMLYTKPENIEAIIDFHKEVISNQEYSNNNSFNIVYFYKNDDRLYRYYELKQSDEYENSKDQLLWPVVNSKEFKEKKLPFVYNDNFFESLEILNITINYEGDENYSQATGVTQQDIDIDILRKKLKNDFNRIFLQKDEDYLNFLLMDRNGYYYNYSYYKTTKDNKRDPMFLINIDNKNENSKRDDHFSFRITEEFSETFEYLKILKEKDVEKLEEIVKEHSLKNEKTQESALNNDIKEMII